MLSAPTDVTSNEIRVDTVARDTAGRRGGVLAGALTNIHGSRHRRMNCYRPCERTAKINR